MYAFPSAHQHVQKMCFPPAVFRTEHISALQDRLWTAGSGAPLMAIFRQHAGDKILEEHYPNCRPSSHIHWWWRWRQSIDSGPQGYASNVLMLTDSSRKWRGIWVLHLQAFHLWTITPTQIRAGGERVKIISFELHRKGLPISLETWCLWADLCLPQIGREKTVIGIPLQLCLSHSSVRYQIGTSPLILANWIKLLTSCNSVLYWDFVLQGKLELPGCSWWCFHALGLLDGC